MGAIDAILPDRSNGQRVVGSWFNAIKNAIKMLFGDGVIVETAFAVANNQVTAADVTGALFSSADSRSARMRYDIKRKTDTASSEVRAVGELVLAYRDETSSWEILGEMFDGDAHGVTFSVTAAGQVQYTSSSIAGANYVGQMRFRVLEAFND